MRRLLVARFASHERDLRYEKLRDSTGLGAGASPGLHGHRAGVWSPVPAHLRFLGPPGRLQAGGLPCACCSGVARWRVPVGRGAVRDPAWRMVAGLSGSRGSIGPGLCWCSIIKPGKGEFRVSLPYAGPGARPPAVRKEEVLRDRPGRQFRPREAAPAS